MHVAQEHVFDSVFFLKKERFKAKELVFVTITYLLLCR